LLLVTSVDSAAEAAEAEAAAAIFGNSGQHLSDRLTM
jgi:hypothetical protein